MRAARPAWRPLSPSELRGAWTEALAAGAPERALMLRRGERLHGELPAVIGGVRREAFVEADAISSTWEGVAVETGGRARLRALDPELAGSAEAHAALLAPALSGAARPAGPLPCLRCALQGPSLGQLVEDDDLHDEAALYRWAATGLAALSALHAEGLQLGDQLLSGLCLGPGGLRCAQLSRPAASAPSGDLRGLAAALSALAVEVPGPLPALLSGWVEDPPPSAADAGLLLRQTMARSLLDRRHRLALRLRNRQARDRHAALRALVDRLALALPPPPARLAAHCGADGLVTHVESDAQRVHAGTAEPGGAIGWGPVWSAEAGLDVARARALMRAWATRGRGDEAARARINAALFAERGQAPAEAERAGERLVRWLAAAARLRAARLLLAHR